MSPAICFDTQTVFDLPVAIVADGNGSGYSATCDGGYSGSDTQRMLIERETYAFEPLDLTVRPPRRERVPATSAGFKKRLLHRYEADDVPRVGLLPTIDVATFSTASVPLEGLTIEHHLFSASSWQERTRCLADDCLRYWPRFDRHSVGGATVNNDIDAVSDSSSTVADTSRLRPVEDGRESAVLRQTSAKPATKRRHHAVRRDKAVSSRGFLWQFLLELLRSPEYNPSHISWVDESRGVFRLNNTRAVSQLWGSSKNKPQMNYETMGRALRYYYSSGILNRVQGQRLVYQFNNQPQ